MLARNVCAGALDIAPNGDKRREIEKDNPLSSAGNADELLLSSHDAQRHNYADNGSERSPDRKRPLRS